MPTKKRTIQALKNGRLLCISVLMPDDMRELVMREADIRKVGQSALVRQAVKVWLQTNQTSVPNTPIAHDQQGAQGVRRRRRLR